MTEPTDAVYWVNDEACERPYTTKFVLISEEMLDAAIQPASVIAHHVTLMRRMVNEFVGSERLSVRGKATLAISWVQPIEENPPHEETGGDDQ